jgi:hypothetical protein
MAICLSACSNSQLRPFTTDGCSAFPDGSSEQRKLWQHCCIAHDYAYWRGGSYQERVAADEVLKSCVAAQERPKTATLMHAGVRMGGTPLLPSTFRWGYGWRYGKTYGPLTAREQRQVELQLECPVDGALKQSCESLKRRVILKTIKP